MMNAEQLQAMKINQEREAAERIRRENAVALLAEKEREIANKDRDIEWLNRRIRHFLELIKLPGNEAAARAMAAEQRLQEAQAFVCASLGIDHDEEAGYTIIAEPEPIEAGDTFEEAIGEFVKFNNKCDDDLRERLREREAELEQIRPIAKAKGARASMSDTNERRAEFVYEGARLAAIAAMAPIVPVAWGEREEDFRKQFLAVIERQCGPNRSSSPEELHGSWMQAYFAMGWVYGETYDREKRIHPDLVPYAQLGQLERDKDAVFVALCEIARNYIYEVEP